MPKKHQTRFADQELPEIKEGAVICRVGATRGGSQFEVYDGENTWLAELPKRFRNTVWIRRGSYVVVDTGTVATGIRGEISFILQKEHISQLRKTGSWPSQMDDPRGALGALNTEQEELADETTSHRSEGSDTDFSDPELFQNNNRR
ncbi:eukaryotic translation initiation factor 1A,X-chromosomal [Ceratobasidium sp. AG-Ba]|nr:eukaryotic translation initiation factor 1A,X-chromosomal [Ceratobasidium sp. AG-Ba]QRW02074.1 eukaryotic translation initiation factor 1A,X-chromosomal [Ceratobasidium sp. AG-Ba]